MNSHLMKLAITLLICLQTLPLNADYVAAFTKERAGLTKSLISVSFLDPKTFKVLTTTEVGKVPNLYNASGFSDSKNEYFYAIVPLAGRKEAQLAVFSLSNHEELTKIPIGDSDLLLTTENAGFIELSDDESRLYILAQYKKKWRLDVYERPSHKLLNSFDLPKKLSTALILPFNRLAMSVLTRNKGRELQMISTLTGENLATHEFPQFTDLRLIKRANSRELAILATRAVPIDRDPRTLKLIHSDIVHLHLMDIETGLKAEPVKLGFEPTILNQDPANQYSYFATRLSLEKTGLTLWRVSEDRVEAIVETDIQAVPNSTLVSEEYGVAVIYSDETAAILDLESQSLRYEVGLPDRAFSGFMNSSATLAYFREPKGSGVGLIDLVNGKLINSVPTGNKGIKLAQAAAVVAGVALTATTGYGYIAIPGGTETVMLTDKEERYLYVINFSTGDITVLNARTLERIGLLEVKSPLLLSHYKHSDYVYALGRTEIVLIDPNTNEIAKSHEDGLFAGINGPANQVYFATKEGLKVIDIATGNISFKIDELDSVFLVLRSD